MEMHNERGNILFLILLAVVLFAALSYAVTQSMRGGGKDASDETISTQASQIMQIAATLEQSVMRLRLANNCSDTQLSFVNSVSAADYTNNSAPGTFQCHMFRPEGAGMAWPAVPKGANDGTEWVVVGRTCVTEVGTGGAPTCAPVNGDIYADLTLILPNVSKKLCTLINKQVGVENPGGDPPQENNNGYFAVPFSGSYANSGLAEIGGYTDEAVYLNGKPTGCFEGYSAGSFPPEGTYHFYHVLRAR